MTDKNRFSKDIEHSQREIVDEQGIRSFKIQTPLTKEEERLQMVVTNKKKKRHGNRAEQRFRRRLRDRNLDDKAKEALVQARIERKGGIQTQNESYETTTELNQISSSNRKIQQDTQTKEIPLDDTISESNTKKRKRDISATISIQISQSLSRMSISQGCAKKKKKKKKRKKKRMKKLPININSSRKNRDFHDPNKILGEMLEPSFIPQYLRVSNRKLKEMLSAAVPNGHIIYNWLDSKEKLKSTRNLVHIVNSICYLKLQQQLWQDYFDVGMKNGVWDTRVPKLVAKEHRTCVSYGRSENLVKRRQSSIQRQMDRNNNELKQELADIAAWTDDVKPSISSILLSTAIEEVVKKGQRQLNFLFKHKQAMLKLDADDHRLISAVYALRPSEAQISLIKLYWQAIANEQKAVEEIEVLRKRIALRRLPASFDKVLDQTIGHIHKMLSRTILHKDRRASMASRCSKTIIQYKFDLMAMTVSIAQDTARGYKELAVETKHKLQLLHSDGVQSSTDKIILAMDIRSENMKKRAQELLRYKLMTFFELAPAVDGSGDNVSAGAI